MPAPRLAWNLARIRARVVLALCPHPIPGPSHACLSGGGKGLPPHTQLVLGSVDHHRSGGRGVTRPQGRSSTRAGGWRPTSSPPLLRIRRYSPMSLA